MRVYWYLAHALSVVRGRPAAGMTAVAAFVGPVGPDARVDLDEHERKRMRAYLKTMVGQKVSISIKRYRAQRSSRQNAYYHGVVVAMLAEHCGYEHDEMHDALAMKFLRIEDCPITGAPRRKRTPQTDTTEFQEFVDACVRLGAELGVVIPDPNEVAA